MHKCWSYGLDKIRTDACIHASMHTHLSKIVTAISCFTASELDKKYIRIILNISPPVELCMKSLLCGNNVPNNLPTVFPLINLTGTLQFASSINHIKTKLGK